MSLKYKFLLFVGVPTLLATFYFSFLATGMYVSKGRIAIRGAEGPSGPEWLAIFGQSSGGTSSDAYVVQEYVRSMDLLKKLDARLEVKKHYQSGEADFISRLAADATAEEFLDYYRRTVRISFDPVTGILLLQARAYTPKMAQQMADAILEESEGLVNRLRDRALRDSLSLAQKEVKVAEERIAAARTALKGFRQANNSIDPEATAGAMLSLVSGLEAEAAKTRTELAEARSYMRDDSARVQSIKARIAALEGQIASEKGRLTGPRKNVLNEVVGEYEKLVVEREFAEKLYVSALSSLEAARIRAEGKSRYLVPVASPTLPEESVYPRRLLSVGVVFAASILIFGIGSLVIAAIREHAGF